MNWSLIVAANDEAVLNRCLANSPSITGASDFRVMRGFSSAGVAYNTGMRQAAGDILVFAHQDVYLPAGWDRCLDRAIAQVSGIDPAWGVLGIFGITCQLQPQGYLYCTASQKILGRAFKEPVKCISLDEVVLVLRRASGLVFDEQLQGFHFYGTDICLEAQRHGLGAYIISAFCIHNAAGARFLPPAFWLGYFYLRRKWRKRLPIRTPCTTITPWAWPVVASILRDAYVCCIKRRDPGRRVPDPAALYAHLMDAQRAAEPAGRFVSTQPGPQSLSSGPGLFE
jgi:hypothetical protein